MLREELKEVSGMISAAIAELRETIKDLSDRVEKLEKAMTAKKPAKGVDDAKL